MARVCGQKRRPLRKPPTGGGSPGPSPAPLRAATAARRSAASPGPTAAHRRAPALPGGAAGGRGGGGRIFVPKCACLLLRSIACQGERQSLKVIPTDVNKNMSRKIADAAALITRDARLLMLLPKCVLALAAVHRVPRRTAMAESDFYRCA